MSVELSEFTRSAFSTGVVNPQLVLEIDGISTLYTAQIIERFIEYGDVGLEYGGGQVYGGKVAIDDQEDLITLTSGTSTRIKQTLNSFPLRSPYLRLASGSSRD